MIITLVVYLLQGHTAAQTLDTIINKSNTHPQLKVGHEPIFLAVDPNTDVNNIYVADDALILGELKKICLLYDQPWN